MKKTKKEYLITAILQVYAVSNKYGANEIFLSLIGLTELELVKIARELNIDTNV